MYNLYNYCVNKFISPLFFFFFLLQQRNLEVFILFKKLFQFQK